MKSLVTVKKFSSRKEKVQNLMHSNSKFKRMFEEYDNMSEDLYNLKVPKEFLLQMISSII